MFINLDFSSTKRALRIILEKEKDEEDEDKDEEEGKRAGEEEGEEEKEKPPWVICALKFWSQCNEGKLLDEKRDLIAK